MSQTILDFMMEDHYRLDGIFKKMEDAKNASAAKNILLIKLRLAPAHCVGRENIFSDF